MDSQTIRTALGQLQVDPESEEAWSSLEEAALSDERDLEQADLLHLLSAARHMHRERGEWDAVAALLKLETRVASGSAEEPELTGELARVLSDELLDDEAAVTAYRRLLELRPDDPRASSAVEESEGKREKWQELVSTYMGEAEQAPDDVYKSSMLMRAAEMELRFGGAEANSEAIVDRLEQAVRLDPANERAGKMLERIFRREERWEEVARALERLADRSEKAEGRVEAGVRLARLYRHKLDDQERAARAYDRVLRESPEHSEAREFISEFYSNEERWDDLVALYERELSTKDLGSPERIGDMLQIAMLHWKKREHPEDAEAWFERIRKIEPAHPLAINFFREYLAGLGDDARLLDVLQSAQRAMSEGPEKTEIAGELAKLAEGQANAQKAIEQYKSILRQDPDNTESRDSLKRLYKQTQGYNALVELLRQQLERTPQEQYEQRLEILREVATVYRQYIKSDTALVSVLNQIVQLDDKLDEHDVDEMRELVSLYEKLSRWRDLLTNQLKLADITPDPQEKQDLFRSAARRWLDQFSNVQNATDAYERLLNVAPEDEEARDRLNELYRKRRAWPKLFDLYQKELDSAQGVQRQTLMKDMAKLAAERLNRLPDAIKLYRQILEEDPSRTEVLDALEKHAERAKDWETLSEALERRVEATEDEQAKLAVLQKLGSVYADQLSDHQKAITAWRRVLELQPGHHRALRVLRDSYLGAGDYDGLQDLYASQDDWDGLADVLSNAADRSKDPQAKIQLSYRAAQVYEEQLAQPDRAFRSYERILATDPSDVRAASALIPLYEEDEKWARLPPLYELLAEHAEALEEKIELYRKLVEVTGQRLSDRKASAEYAKRAYEIAPDNDGVREMFEEAVRAAGAWDVFVQAVEQRLAAGGSDEAEPARGKKKGKKKGKNAEAEVSGLPEEERRMLELRLGEVYARELGRPDDAVTVYKRVVERNPGDLEAVAALEKLLRQEDRRDELRWLLDLRVTNATTDADQLVVLRDWASLEQDVFGSQEKAAELYQRVLELDPTDLVALRALPPVLIASGDVAGGAAVKERLRDQLDGAERAECEIELAELFLDKLERPSDALEAAVRALDIEPGNSRAMSVVQRLVDDETVRGRAAEVLAEQYASGGEARREAEALSVMLEQSSDADERISLYQRLADVQEEKLDAFSAALDVMLKAVREFPNHIAFWDRADSLAVLAGRPTDLGETFRDVLRGSLPEETLRELSERAARLHEEKLGDPMGATPYLEKVLDLEPSNERAFGRLKDILTGAERWSELESLYDKASKATDDDVRRVEMLNEVALISEEIIEDAAKATRHYERILEIDPMHEGAIQALDRLYAQQERHEDLAGLLSRRLDMESGDEMFELKLRLARIQLEKLHEPAKAIVHVEDVLRERPNDYEARELAEKMLEIGSLRVQAARMLEVVYEARDEIRDLVRVLEIRLEGLATPSDDEAVTDDMRLDEKKDLLRRISTLRDDRLHDDQGALEAVAELVPMEPLDIESRERLVEIGRRLGAHERVAEVLTRAAAKADTVGMQGEILMQVAGIYEDLLGNHEKAEETYRRVLDLDATDAELVLPAARSLERIYMGAGEHQKLAEVLRTQVKLEQDGDARRELLGRLGELCQNLLEDNEGAIGAWTARLEENPADEAALAALDGLYEQTERWRDLVGVLERRRDVTDDVDLRRTLMVRMAVTLAGKLDATSEAIDAWRAVLDEYGPDPESLAALEGLYEKASRYDELAETYEMHLDLVDDESERLALLARLGDLQRVHLNDPMGALETYRRALTIDTAHTASRDALEKLLESDDPVARRESAEVLHPIYEADGDNERLLRVLEIEIESSDEPMVKLEGLEKAMQVAEGPLGDDARAFGYAKEAVKHAAGHTDVGPWLEHLERLANATSRQKDYVDLLCEIVPEIFDGDVQLSVTLKIADLARHQLADRDLAKEYYKKALETRPDERQALVALESLYDEAGDAQNLLEVLERRVEIADSDDERKQLLFRRAKLLDEALDDKGRAIEVYETILDMDMDRGAIEALERLYPAEQRWSEMVELYQRQLDEAGADKPGLHVKIAQISARHMSELGRAFDELEAALEIEHLHDGAIAELERLLSDAPEAEHRSRAASLLEPVYLARADYERVMDAIKGRLEYSQDPEEKRDLLGRLAQLYEEQTEDYSAALETTAKLFHEDMSDEETVAELERLAKVAGAEKRLAQIYASELEDVAGDDPTTAKLAKRTGELFDQLGELDRALGFYRRALAFDPEGRELFDAIDDILRRTERPEERVQLYRDALDHRFDPTERLQTLHTIASLLRTELEQPDEAIETYRQALDVEETDEVSLDALTELYRDRERWDDLSELYLRRAELAPSAERAAAHRLALARLFNKELASTERAIDQLEEIVRTVPTHDEGIAELEALRDDEQHKERVVEILRPLYEAADDWRHLIKLNEDRYQLADDPVEKVTVLRETSRLWEERGHDAVRARRALAVAVKLDPDDPDVRGDFERLCEVTGAWSELADTYDKVLEEQPDMASKRDVLATLARVHDEQRDDPRRALNAYDRLFQVDQTELEPLNKMEELATLLSDWDTLVRVQTAKADLLLDDAERASVWRRVGEAKRDMLEDQAGAIEAYERAMDMDPDSAFTVDCLIALYEEKGDAERLVELYQRRVELCGDEDEELKYELLMNQATVLEKQLEDRLRAIEALNQALGVRAGDKDVLDALNRLYRAEEMWSELLDNLRLMASMAESTEERATLRKQMGRILAEKLTSYDEALEAYRQVLDEVPDDGESVAAVRQIGKDHEELRLLVAEILVPVLKATAKHEQLVDVLEMRLTSETDPSDRCETLRTIAEVQESQLSSPSDALSALLLALSERPEDVALHSDIERLAEASDGWSRYAHALGERAQATFDPEVGKDLYTRLGRVAEEKLGEHKRAVEAYSHAVDQAGDQPELLGALDRLYTELGDSRALSDVIERRVVIEEGEKEQAELYHRLGVIQIGDFNEAERGLGSLRMALERNPEHEAAAQELEKLTEKRELFDEAAEVLENVYRQRGQTDRLAGLYEKRVGFAGTPGERIDMRRDLARVLEEDAGDAAAAQRVLQQGLSDDPTDGALLEEIERLASTTNNWEGAAAALRDAIEGSNDLLSDTARDLCVRLATWQRDRIEDNAAAEAALVKALEFEPNSDEVLVLLEQLQGAPGREKNLVETLRRRGRMQLDPEKRDELYQKAKSLADQVEDPALAEEVLRELIEHDDANLWALAELTTLRENAEDWKETYKLLVRRSELRAQGDIIRQLRHKAAGIAQEKLDDKAKAIDLYNQLFEDDPTDEEASRSLRELYAAAERWEDLGELLERLIDMAEGVEQRSALRLELAKLNEQRFDAPDTAIDLLRTVIEDDPSNAHAVVALSELYEKTNRDQDLADLLNEQIAAAKDRGDVEAELKFEVRLGEVYDSRLGDRKKAIETYERVLEREPNHRGALEALTRLHQADGSHADAAKILDRLVGMSEGDEKIALSLALADEHGKLDDAEGAAAALERGLEVDDKHEELRSRLRALYESSESWEKLAGLIAGDAEYAEDPKEKVKLLRQAATIHGEKRKDHGAAAELLAKASELSPDDRELMLELCDAYSASGRGKAAAEVLEKIVESYGGRRSKELGDIHRRLADAHLAEGDKEGALKELDKAFRIEPGNVHVLRKLGEVALDANDLKKAQQMFRALLLQRLDAKSPITKAEVFANLGEVHYRLDEKPKAIQMFERALQQDDSLEKAKERLAELKG